MGCECSRPNGPSQITINIHLNGVLTADPTNFTCDTNIAGTAVSLNVIPRNGPENSVFVSPNDVFNCDEKKISGDYCAAGATFCLPSSTSFPTTSASIHHNGGCCCRRNDMSLSATIPMPASSYLSLSVGVAIVLVSSVTDSPIYPNDPRVISPTQKNDIIKRFKMSSGYFKQKFGVEVKYTVYEVAIDIDTSVVPAGTNADYTEFWERLWRTPALTNLGYPPVPVSGKQVWEIAETAIGLLVDDVKARTGSTWGVAGFYHNFNSATPDASDPTAVHANDAYALGDIENRYVICYKGVYTNPNYASPTDTSQVLLDMVITHESMHLFGAQDEYLDPDPNVHSGTNVFPNYNSEYTIQTGINKPVQRACIMDQLRDSGGNQVCFFTRGQLGCPNFPAAPWSLTSGGTFLADRLTSATYKGETYVFYRDANLRLSYTKTASGRQGQWNTLQDPTVTIYQLTTDTIEGPITAVAHYFQPGGTAFDDLYVFYFKVSSTNIFYRKLTIKNTVTWSAEASVPGVTANKTTCLSAFCRANSVFLMYRPATMPSTFNIVTAVSSGVASGVMAVTGVPHIPTANVPLQVIVFGGRVVAVFGVSLANISNLSYSSCPLNTLTDWTNVYQCGILNSTKPETDAMNPFIVMPGLMNDVFCLATTGDALFVFYQGQANFGNLSWVACSNIDEYWSQGRIQQTSELNPPASSGQTAVAITASLLNSDLIVTFADGAQNTSHTYKNMQAMTVSGVTY